MVVVGDLAVLKATFNYVCACRRTSEPWREGREGREPRVGAAPPVECGPSSDARGADPNRSTLHNPMGGGVTGATSKVSSSLEAVGSMAQDFTAPTPHRRQQPR